MRWPERTGTLPNRLFRAFPIILLALAGTFVLNRLGFLTGLEHYALDTEMAAAPRASADLRIVDISDADYDDLFGGRSPLDVAKLQELIGAIALSNPAVIGVDIDTSHPQFKSFAIDPKWPPIIWERELSSPDATGANGMLPLDVLGGQNPGLNADSGVPALLDDPDDKVTRLYTKCISSKAGPLRSFVDAIATPFVAARSSHTAPGSATPAEIAAAFRDAATNPASKSSCVGAANDDEQARFIKFSLRPVDVDLRSASQVIGLSGLPDAQGGGQAIPDLAGKIVLLGGSYRDFDRHFTPIGEETGMMILANAVQTELDGGGPTANSRSVTFLLEVTASLLFVTALQRLSPSPARLLLQGVALVALISLGFSFFAFHSFSRVGNFLPTLFAVLVFEVYEHIRHESLRHAAKGAPEAPLIAPGDDT